MAEHADRAAAVVDEFRNRLITAYTENPPHPLPGIPEALTTLRAAGIRVALTTGFDRDIVDSLLDVLGWEGDSMVDTVVCGSDVAAGRLRPDKIDEELFHRYLDEPDIPDVDLWIRSSGEQRLSNFLLWQSAYAELVFLDTLWPDFDKSHLEEAIAQFRRRERRYGGVGS